MTHGDAIVIMRDKRSTDQARLEALEYIVNNEHESDINNISKPAMWRLLKMVYQKYKANLNN